MRACPSCGHEGEPNTVKRDKYSVLTCSLCGVGLGVELHFEGPSADRPAQSHHNTTDTDAYKLTPTGPHKVVSAAAHQRVGQQTSIIRGAFPALARYLS